MLQLDLETCKFSHFNNWMKFQMKFYWKLNDSREPQSLTSRVEEKTEEKQSKTDDQCLSATEHEYLSRHDERLKRFKAESQAHMNRVKSINQRASDVDTNAWTFVHAICFIVLFFLIH